MDFERDFSPSFQIAGVEVGASAPPVVIAEAGVAHFGDPGKMDALVDLAADAGADIFKTQAYVTDQMIAAGLPEWRDRMRIKEVGADFLKRAKERCDRRGLVFLCTAHDETALEWLIDMDVAAYKIGSGEKGNWPFIHRIAALGRPVILSTGMYELADVDSAVETCASAGLRELAILHCVTSYPIPDGEVNLLSLPFMAARYPLPIGYSDHTEGHAACLGAVAMGAKIIEKHIALEFNIPNAQDWKVSAGPDDFAAFVQSVKRLHNMRGLLEKKPRPCERAAEGWAVKRVVARRALPSGHLLGENDLVCKRAGAGAPPAAIPELVGMRLTRAVTMDEPITADLLESA